MSLLLDSHTHELFYIYEGDLYDARTFEESIAVVPGSWLLATINHLMHYALDAYEPVFVLTHQGFIIVQHDNDQQARILAHEGTINGIFNSPIRQVEDIRLPTLSSLVSGTQLRVQARQFSSLGMKIRIAYEKGKFLSTILREPANIVDGSYLTLKTRRSGSKTQIPNSIKLMQQSYELLLRQLYGLKIESTNESIIEMSPISFELNE